MGASTIYLLTDIPVWVRPLVKALVERGVEVRVVAGPGEVDSPEVVVNRISTRVARRSPEQVAVLGEALAKWETDGVRVIHGADCLSLGFSKRKQSALFERCGLRTPRTAPLQKGVRSFPESAVLIKPPAGGFGKGIRSLGAGEEVPADCGGAGWIEQERIDPSDGLVHRVEILGKEILYQASTPWVEEEFNYCLANTEDRTTLTAGHRVSREIREAVQQVSRTAGMELGAIEYLVGENGRPLFIDLNPVSSLHPKAEDLLGYDPLRRTAEYLAGG